MKLLIFSPVIEKSAIARMSALVVRELVAQGHEVTIVQTESESIQKQSQHSFGVKVISWQDLYNHINLIKEIDQFVYQIGNNYEFHEGGIHWLQFLPGVVCLHDFFLGHLFQGYAGSNRKEAKCILELWYGAELVESFFECPTEALVESFSDAIPLTEWVCSMARGVIVHSAWGAKRVLESCPGPVVIVPMAYDAKILTVPDSGDSKITILSIGHVNSNKRIGKVIEAIASSSYLQSISVFKVAGKVEKNEAMRLRNLASNHNVDVQILGEVDSLTMNKLFSEAQIVTCLRKPALESSSASAVEAMLHGKAVICNDVGFYSEIPDDLVMKIDLSKNEIKEISKALKFLCRNLNQSKSMGNKARIWAENTFRADSYARSLVEVATLTIKASPAIEAIEKFTVLASDWISDQVLFEKEALVSKLEIFSRVKE